MSYKSELFARYSTSDLTLPPSGSRSWLSSSATSRDAEFLRAWLVYDSEVQTDVASGRTRFSRLLGVALLVGISASVWAGIGLMIARLWN